MSRPLTLQTLYALWRMDESRPNTPSVGSLHRALEAQLELIEGILARMGERGETAEGEFQRLQVIRGEVLQKLTDLNARV